MPRTKGTKKEAVKIVNKTVKKLEPVQIIAEYMNAINENLDNINIQLDRMEERFDELTTEEEKPWYKFW